MNLIALGLVSGTALALTAFAGPTPRDPTTNKPSREQCEAAERDARVLLGCAEEGDDEADEASSPAQPNRARPSNRFMVCPQDPRCPR